MALMDADLATLDGGNKSAQLRALCPQFAAALDDFYLCLSYPQAIDWAQQGKGWKFCQRVFAARYRRIQGIQQAKQVEMLKTFLEVMAKRSM